jgi:hypothetical protein
MRYLSGDPDDEVIPVVLEPRVQTPAVWRTRALR